MAEKELHISGAGGLPLFARLWESPQPARAFILIIHGHGEHSGRYAHVGQALSGRGFSTLALDLRGHGRSGGARGFVHRWEDYREDLAATIEAMRGEWSSLPGFLYGHSVGGTVALDYVMRNPQGIKGVIATAPSLGRPNIPKYLFAISKVVSVIYPRFSMATQLDQSSLSRDPEVVRAYREDPLVHSVGTARLGTELLITAEWIQANARMMQLPFLLIHGENDRLVFIADNHRFFENVGSSDKTFVEMPEGFHEPHNDLDKLEVIKSIGDWVEARI